MTGPARVNERNVYRSTTAAAGRASVAVLFVAIPAAACGGGGSAPPAGGGTGTTPPTQNPPPPPPPPPPSPGWSSQTLIGSLRDSFFYDIYLPHVALNDAGAAVAVWQEHTDTN